MIKFFRHIRQNLIMENKTSKYLKYAIGEIILVVIGILIALQINNWNEGRKGKIDEISTLNKFMEDLESDSTYYQSNLKTVKEINQLHKNLYRLGFKNEESVTLEKPAYIRRSLIYNPIAKDNTPNILNKINDDGVREAIQRHFRLMSEVLETKNEHENVVLEIRALFRQLKVHHLNAWFESAMVLGKESTINKEIITSDDLVRLAKNEEFQQLLFESSIKAIDLQKSLLNLIQSNSELVSTIKLFIND